MTRIRCVVLMGPRAAGKTTLMEPLARALGWQHADGDLLLAAAAGQPAAQYLVQAGEPAFRAVEQRVTVAALAGADRLVLALGGGAILSEAVRSALAADDVFPVLLLAPVPVLVRRLQQEPRPGLTDLAPADEVAHLLSRRAPYYRALARLELDTAALDPESCVRRVVQALPIAH